MRKKQGEVVKILLIKTSSLGDVIHTLPALTDAKKMYPEIQIEWLLEPAFSEIAHWHPAVTKVIAFPLRKFLRKPWCFWQTWQACKDYLQQTQYDYVVDMQGLLKTAWLMRYGSGQRHGYDKYSAREALASRFYSNTHQVAKTQHAVERNRQLMAQSLDYTLNHLALNYGVLETFTARAENKHSIFPVLFFHATTWTSKHWIETSWIMLAKELAKKGIEVHIPWGSEEEKKRAERIAQQTVAKVLPAMSLTQLAETLLASRAAIAVDTGLAHLAAALDIPCITLFGATNPGLTRNYGKQQQQLVANKPCVPCLQKKCKYRTDGRAICFETITANDVMQLLHTMYLI